MKATVQIRENDIIINGISVDVVLSADFERRVIKLAECAQRIANHRKLGQGEVTVSAFDVDRLQDALQSVSHVLDFDRYSTDD